MLKCAQVLNSLLEEDVSAEEDLEQLLQDGHSKLASLLERLLNRNAQNDEQMTDSAPLEVRLGASLPFW